MNKRIKFMIELLSDTCCGNGNGNGMDIDVACCYDEYGFPIIPGKRLKGLVREKAFILSDNGKYKEEEIISLFGDSSGVKSRLKFENAVLHDIDEICTVAQKYKPYQIKRVFSNKRNNTAIDVETGIAKKTSKRTVETVDRGLIFYGIVDVFDAKEKDEMIIENSLKLLRSIGTSKNRGLGEVLCEIIEKCDMTVSKPLNYTPAKDVARMDYTLTLLQNITFKANSPIQQLDYVPGSAVQGFFANRIREYDFFYDVIFNDLLFLNAYISDGKNRYLPCPQSLVSIKNKAEYTFNLADNYAKDEKEQYVGINGYGLFDDDEYIKKSVKIGSEYHIKRKNKDLFSFKKIKRGQIFKGSIIASEDALNIIKDILQNEDNIIYVGSSSTAQYGKCKMEITNSEPEKIKINDGDNVVLEFLSDIIIIDEYGNNSVKAEALINEIKRIIYFESYQLFLKTSVVGGYNSKWKMPKGQWAVFSKGSVVVLNNCNETEMPSTLMIGVDSSEGYGEVKIRKQKTKKQFEVSENPDIPSLSNENNYPEKAKKLMEKIELNEDILSIKLVASDYAEIKYNGTLELSKSAFMRVQSLYLGIIRENEQANLYNDFKERLETFEKNKELYNLAKSICERFESLSKKNQNNINVLFEVFLRSFIRRTKELYQLSKKEGEIVE